MNVEQMSDETKIENFKAQTDFFQALINAIPSPVFYKDRQGRYTGCNKAFEEFVGRSRDEIIGKTVYDMGPKEIADEYHRMDEALFENPGIQKYDWKVVAKNGRVRDVLFVKAPILDPDGRMTGLIGVIFDITERKQIERTVEQERERLEGILASLNTGLSLIDPDMRIVWVNKKIREMFPDSEPVGQVCYGFYESRKTPCRNCSTLQAFETGKAEETERFNASKGRWYHIVSQPVKNDKGQIVHVLEGIADITERKKVKEALRQSYEIINASPAAAFLWKNQEGWPVEYVSENSLSVMGYKAEDLTSGKIPYASIIHPEDLDRVAREVSFFSQNRKTTSFHHAPYRIIRSDGKVRWVDDQTTIRRNDQGRITHYQGIVLDITERLELERQVEQARKRESLATMAGAIAHHFNNHLTSVFGNLDLAAEILPQDSVVGDLLLEVKKAARRSAELSRLMLIYVGQEIRRKAPLDLAAAVRKLIPEIHSALPANVHLKLDLPPAEHMVMMDPDNARQVLTHLITNAWEAVGTEEGVVHIAVRLVESAAFCSGVVFPETFPGSGPWVCLEVTDSGRGMDTETQARMFDPFFTTKFTGRGLGLAVTLGIVAACEGAIFVDSNIGKGTTIRVLLPAIKHGIGDDRPVN